MDNNKIIIVGGGITGLTAAAALTKKGHNVLLLEKNEICGGLVNSFNREGFIFDGGIRAIENAGMLKPMLEELNIDINFLPSKVSVGIEDKIICADDENGLIEYERILKELYPNNIEDVDNVIKVIAQFDVYMKVLFGDESPFYKDIKHDVKYYFTTFFVWFFKFLRTGAAIMKMQIPMEEFLHKIIENQSLFDIISQHFFKKTPAFFAMSYFSLYPDYSYPEGGVGKITEELSKHLVENGSQINTNSEVIEINTLEKYLIDSNGAKYSYDKLLWCADLKNLYKKVDAEGYPSKIKKEILEAKESVLSSYGAESVFSLYLALDIEPSYFNKISHGHFFYTPSKVGLNDLHTKQQDEILKTWDNLNRDNFYNWLREFCLLNTYEISIPVLNDPNTAPKGKTGFIASFLFNYEITKRIKKDGWFDEFEEKIKKFMIEALSSSIYPELNGKIIFSFTSNPLSIEKRVNSSEGAIVGWSFENKIPIKAGMLNMKKAVLSPFDDIYLAGQWTVSPAGLPTCIMTAKMASDLIHKKTNK